MSGFVNFVDNSNGTNAHENFVNWLETQALANGWTTLRKTNTGGTGDARVYELIMQGVGLSGTEQIFVGVRAYQNSTADWYNLEWGVFSGYVSANTWAMQPGFFSVSCCAHNQRIDFWVNINAQRWAGVLKVGTPVYEHFYVGKFFPNASPTQYPYPVIAIGTIYGGSPARYSNVDFTQSTSRHAFGYYGFQNDLNGRLRWLDNTWIAFYTIPHVGGSANVIRDENNNWDLIPLQICNGVAEQNTPQSNIMGYLDGVRYCSGFNLTVESTTVQSGVTWTLLQDVNRNAINAFIVLDITS